MSLQAAYILPHPPLAVPEIGRGQEVEIEATIAAYREVARRVAYAQPDTVIFISPHTAYFKDWIFVASGEGMCGDFSLYRASEVGFSLKFDRELRKQLVEEAQGRGIEAGYVEGYEQQLDHGVMVPLSYIDKEYSHNLYQAILIGGSALPREKLLAFGSCLGSVLTHTSKKCILIVSGDLSHKGTEDGPYGFDPSGPVFDALFGEIIKSGDLMRFAALDLALCEAAAECGLSGFIMLAGAIEEVEDKEDYVFSSQLLSLEGPFGVGYGVAAFEQYG